MYESKSKFFARWRNSEKLKGLAEKEYKPVPQWITDAVLKAVKEQDEIIRHNIRNKGNGLRKWVWK